MVPDPTGRSGKVTLGWVYSSENKEKSGRKGQGGSWEAEGCREEEEEEEEDIGVPPMALRQGARGKSCPFGRGWEIIGHRI